MTPERWTQIEELFHQVAERDVEKRASLLDAACNGDMELRQAVEELLASEKSARHDMRAAVNGGLAAVTFPLIGQTVSHYRILGGLGGGGMGLIYRAEDIKLGRQVALKFLPEESAGNPEALSRFEREARSASALEHPNICPVYEFGEHEGQPFLVMQLLEGQTLRELISETEQAKLPLELKKLLDIALQIAGALEAAHLRGIIHRDIKPANIFVTTKGQVKLLDFGLAKLSHGDVPEEEARQLRRDATGGRGAKEKTSPPTIPDMFLSRTGAAMGTAGYMSPEQACGEKLDARTDLFSFGLVLYEMATGQPAFEGDTGPEVILKQAPAPTMQFTQRVPAKLEAIISKALEKDRGSRYQSASELRTDLEGVQELLRRSKSLQWSKGRPARWIWGTLGTAAFVLLSAFGLTRFLQKVPNSRLSPVDAVPLIAMKGKQISPAFSPDGNQVAFAELGGPHPGIYTTRVGDEKPRQLTENPRDCCPIWSPDGRQIAFVRYSGPGTKREAGFPTTIHPLYQDLERSFYVIPALGGPEHRLYTGPLNSRPYCDRLDWSPDGRALVFSGPTENGDRSAINLLSLSDLTTRQITLPQNQAFDCGPAFSPDGLSVAFVRGTFGGDVGDLFVVAVSGDRPKQLTFGNSGGSPAWTQNGEEIVFTSGMGGLRSLWRIPVSGGTPRAVGGVGEMAISPSISRKGNQLAYQHIIRTDNIWRIDLRDSKHAFGSPIPIFSGRGYVRRPCFSPDGKKVAFESDRLGYSDIWYCESDGSNCTQLTSLHGMSGTARWSPDGHYIAFEALSQQSYEVYVVEVPGGQPHLVPTFPGAHNGAPNWSRDGQWIYFYSSHQGGPFQLWKVPFKGGSPIPVTKNGGVYAIESNDGRFLYYTKADQAGVWSMPLGGGEESRVLNQPSKWWNWTLAGTGIYILNDSVKPNGRIEFFDFATREMTPIFSLEKPVSDFGGLAVSPDVGSLLYGQTDLDDSYIMLVKNFR